MRRVLREAPRNLQPTEREERDPHGDVDVVGRTPTGGPFDGGRDVDARRGRGVPLPVADAELEPEEREEGEAEDLWGEG